MPLFKLDLESRKRERLLDGSYTPAIPANTQGALNEDFDAFLFYPHRLHIRQINQLAAYTVHPNPKTSNDFCQILRPEEKLVQYIIPKEIKAESVAKLWSLGMRCENIFPDPDGAAKGGQICDREWRRFDLFMACLKAGNWWPTCRMPDYLKYVCRIFVKC